MASTQEAIEGLLRRLNSPISVVAQQAVVGVFATLKAKGASSSADARSTEAIAACLSKPSTVSATGFKVFSSHCLWGGVGHGLRRSPVGWGD